MTSPCSVTLLEMALADDMSPEQEESLHRHLEECEACTAALEQMAGGAAWCREAADLLIGDELDDAVPGYPRAGGDEWSNVDFTVEHLEPSEQPNVLGRLGGYDVLEIIGRGGMGVVLKAFDRELKRCVAIKVLSPHLAQSSLAKKRFIREAQAAAAVVHPNVLAIHQVQPSGRLPFLVMPLVAGESLAQRLTAQGRLELKETLRIGVQAAAGLAAAHEQGLVHRDVKPANILLEKGVERAVLTDFGLARAADDVSMTRWGIIAGTPQYMSPEQARGEPLDGRSDLFSLGCVLYEMATGVSPFRADSTMATLRRLIDDPPPAMASLNPELPPWFIGIVNRLLEKDSSRRFASAKEVSELLEGCLAHLQQPASVPLPESLPVPAAHPVSKLRNTLWKGAITMIATLGIALLGIFLMQSTEPPDIAGRWSGEEWGQVVLAQTAAGEYAGTYSETVGKAPGKIQLKWSRIERRFNGTWRKGDDRFGDLSIRLADHEIRGALTTDPKSKINPATPRLADLSWTRIMTTSSHVNIETAATPAVTVVEEREAVTAIRQLGGWCKAEKDGHVTELDMTRSVENTAKAIPYLKSLSQLRRLRLFGPAIENDSLKQIARVSTLHSLFIDGGQSPTPAPHGVSDLGIACFADHPNLQFISITNAGLTDRSLRTFSTIRNLQFLTLQGNHFTDEGLKHLAGMTNLRQVIIDGGETHISDAGAAHLSDLVNLESLWLQGCTLTDRGLKSLPRAKKLRSLELTGAQFTDDGLRQLAEMCPELVQLGFDADHVTGKGIDNLRSLSKLNFLTLRHAKHIDAAVFARLKEALPSLTVYNADDVKATESAVDPAAELKALQGQWKVVRVEKGKDASVAWGTICGFFAPTDPADVYRLDFAESEGAGKLQVRDFDPRFDSSLWVGEFAYRIDPTAAPKTIDLLLYGSKPGVMGEGIYTLVAQGIYQIDGDRLMICLTRHLPSLRTDHRPKSFAVAPNSGDILFVLERHRPSEDEKTIQGCWKLTAEVENGESASEAKLPGTEYVFYDFRVLGDTLLRGAYLLDTTKQPKTITLGSGDLGKPQIRLGIYKLEGERLHIAYRKNGPRPEKFESKPGSGVTLLVLKKTKPMLPQTEMGFDGMGGIMQLSSPVPQARPSPPGQATAEASTVDPTADLLALQGSWKVVRVEKGSGADAFWGAIAGEGPPLDPATTSRLNFDNSEDPPLHLVRPARGFVSAGLQINYQSAGCVQGFYYRIDPTTAPATIDLLAQGFSSTGLALGEKVVASGIYKIENDQLQLCIRRTLPEIVSDQRPKQFAVAPTSTDILFVASRYCPSDDERAIQYEWTLVDETVDGKNAATGTAPKVTGIFRFTKDDYFYAQTAGGELGKSQMFGVYFLDPAKQPKAIMLHKYLENRSLDKKGDLGIYKFDGDRLTLAYRLGGPPPENFESKPGSGITLLVLERAKLKTRPKPDETKAGKSQAPPNPATIPFAPDFMPE